MQWVTHFMKSFKQELPVLLIFFLDRTVLPGKWVSFRVLCLPQGLFLPRGTFVLQFHGLFWLFLIRTIDLLLSNDKRSIMEKEEGIKLYTLKGCKIG